MIESLHYFLGVLSYAYETIDRGLWTLLVTLPFWSILIILGLTWMDGEDTL